MERSNVEVFFYSRQEIVERDLGGRNVLGWLIERVDMPTDEGVISTKDSNRFFYKSVRVLPCVCVVKDVDEGIVGQDNPNFYYCIIQNLNVVGGDEVRAIAGVLYGTGERDRAYVSH